MKRLIRSERQRFMIGPIDPVIHSDQFDAEMQIHGNQHLTGFSKAAKYYTEGAYNRRKNQKQINLLLKAVSDGLDAGYEYADTVIAKGITAAGAKDVVFIDLNQPWLDWMKAAGAKVKEIRGSEVYEKNAVDYYFRGVRAAELTVLTLMTLVPITVHTYLCKKH